MPLPVIGAAIASVALRVAPALGGVVARYAPRMANWLHADAAIGGANTVTAVDTAYEAKDLAKEVGGLASDVAKTIAGGAREHNLGPADEKAVRIAAAMEDMGGRGAGKGIER